MADLAPAYDDLPVGVALVASTGEMLEVNDCLAGWLGQPASAVQGSRIDQWLTRAGRVLYHTHMLPTLQLHGRLQELSLSLRVGDSALPVLACAALSGTRAEQRIRLVLSPMRERQRLELALQRAHRAADAAPVLLFEYELDCASQGMFTYLSAGVARLYGPIDVQAMVPEDLLWSHVHPDDLPILMEARETSWRTNQVWYGHFRARAKGSTEWAFHHILAQPQASSEGCWTWHGTIADVTQQREVEQAARMRDAAERASAAKSEFMARMSHELRTPLNGILGFSQLMAEDPREVLGTEQRRRLGVVNASARQLLALINDLMDIARIEAGELRLQLQAQRLLPLLQQSLAAVEPMAITAGLGVTLHCPFSVAVRVDATRLQQVLTNLLSNAVKYNRPQGKVEVAVATDDGRVRIEVRDNGPGMSSSQMGQLFQPFNRLGAERSSTEGTGLGLVITRQLVEAMQGHLEVQSQPGQGSCFTVSLPGAQAGSAAVAGSASDLEAASGLVERRRVLYVEDNPVNALLMQQALQALTEVQLRVVSSGEAALACVTEWLPDLLLLDMHLDDTDGQALLRRLRTLPGLTDVPAVAVSADAMPADMARAREAGFQDYWIKPIDVHRLRIDLLRLLSAPRAVVSGTGR